MKIDERFVIRAPIEKVWAFVRDPATAAPCLPGCEKVEQLSNTSYRAEIVVALGPIKARFNVIVTITEESPPFRLVCETKGEEGSKASFITASNEVRFVIVDEQITEIFCTSEASIVGRLGKFGLGVMKKRASQIAGEFAAAVQAGMEAGHD
jgi:carbon monoxide dehydrogenase subunit G